MDQVASVKKRKKTDFIEEIYVMVSELVKKSRAPVESWNKVIIGSLKL